MGPPILPSCRSVYFEHPCCPDRRFTWCIKDASLGIAPCLPPSLSAQPPCRPPFPSPLASTSRWRPSLSTGSSSAKRRRSSAGPPCSRCAGRPAFPRHAPTLPLLGSPKALRRRFLPRPLQVQADMQARPYFRLPSGAPLAKHTSRFLVPPRRHACPSVRCCTACRSNDGRS